MGKHKNKIKDHSPKHKRMKTKRKRSSHTKKYSREGRSSRRRKSDVSSSDDSMFRDDTSSVESTQDKSRDHSRKRRRGKDDENSSSFVQKKGSESCSEDSSSDDKRENNAGAGSRRKSKKSKELSPFTKSYERWRNIPGSEDFKGHLQRTLVEPQSSTTDDRRKYFRRDDRGKQIYVNKSRKHHDSSHELSEGAKSSASRENSPESSNERSQNEDKDFSFTVYQYELNKIFCRDASLIPDKEDFWLFVKKYEAMKRTKSQKCNLEELEKKIATFEIPSKLPRTAERILKATDEELMGYLPPFDEYDRRQRLTKLLFREFRLIIRIYLDFREKERISKEKKIQESRASLPVAQYRDEIIKAVQSERVVIIAGDTGCGKSTQIPQYLMEAGYNRIACTQPRRIACISLSKRVAYETLSEAENLIGYQIRFEKQKRQDTKIVFITEGLFLRQVASEGWGQYDVVVLDEVHERHLTSDFLLGVVKCLLHQREDVKIILMSATINIKLICTYFGDLAKVIQVPGRLHPIKLEYHPIPASERSERFDPAPFLRIMQLIDKKYPRDERGDLLIFVSGMAEITAVIDVAKSYNERDGTWIVLPLHSSLSIADQDKVFDYPPEGMRKCIVSTNIAETSITIDGVRFVADSGKVKEMMYDSVAKMQKLKEVWVSRASAEQRKGRAGRTGPGVCFRLYSEEEYTDMAPYSTPEIQRVPLDSVILQIVAMGLPDARKFPFIEPPPAQCIEVSITSLKQHGALSFDESLTSIGEMLSRLPVDIPLGKMLINGSLFHQLEPILSLAAALSVQNPFTNRAYRDPECENSRKLLESDHGDPITLLNAYREWLEVKSGKVRGVSSRHWCRRRGLEEQRFYEMTKLRKQFKQLLQDCNLLPSEKTNAEKMSSAERALRHGELKLLRSAKRQHQNEAPRKRKILKPDSWELMYEGEEEKDDTVDIGDIDFRLANDSLTVQNLLSGSTTCSYKDLTMLKLILCSGLYPQFAIADEFNHVKTVSEQLFHTPTKPFVSLHPMGYFANHSDVLKLSEAEIEDINAEGFSAKYPVSTRHQLLCFMSLLETTKPFLVNTLRIPAAHSLLLFSLELHTSNNFSKIVCDSWIQLKFPLPEAAEIFVLKAVKLRLRWEELLKLRLEKRNCAAIEQTMCQDLVKFMTIDIGYSIQRILPATLKTIYVKSSHSAISGINPINPDFEITENAKYGGYDLCSFLVYDCLENDVMMEWDSWTCGSCGLTAALSSFEKLQHKVTCAPESQLDEAESSTSVVRKANAKQYKCVICNQELYLTPVEILKHQKSHSQ
ncbi:unnamed protein product [Bemisia tabaci]|uniref:ATP-dependent RNA helicase DHX34 n=1 Tax=Bemisia tabaci TaxID=7038 RepID=A0A9P0EWH5_BEMTA|nr:unnamed protein product [Bemisia tabaci]